MLHTSPMMPVMILPNDPTFSWMIFKMPPMIPAKTAHANNASYAAVAEINSLAYRHFFFTFKIKGSAMNKGHVKEYDYKIIDNVKQKYNGISHEPARL